MRIKGVEDFNHPNELKYLEKDIVDEFKGKNYIVGTPTLIQLSRNIQRLNESLEKHLLNQKGAEA